jgi:hypothetical protein
MDTDRRVADLGLGGLLERLERDAHEADGALDRPTTSSTVSRTTT